MIAGGGRWAKGKVSAAGRGLGASYRGEACLALTVGSGGGAYYLLCDGLADVLQEAGDLVNRVASVNVGLHVPKCLVSEDHGEIGELQQPGNRLGDRLARLFKQGTQFIEVVGSGKGHSQAASQAFRAFSTACWT